MSETSLDHPKPDAPVMHAEFDVVIGLKTVDESIDIQVSTPDGSVDLGNRAHYLANWLCANMSLLFSMAMTSRKNSAPAVEDAKVIEAVH